VSIPHQRRVAAEQGARYSEYGRYRARSHGNYGAFTLLGGVAGAIIGGSLTLTMEILRRRWQRQDGQYDSDKTRRASEIKERKELYPQLLAKGLAVQRIGPSSVAIAMGTVTVDEPTTPEDIARKIAKAFSDASGAMDEFENLRAKAEMLAGEYVQGLIRQWD
jgi:hypothetical protein